MFKDNKRSMADNNSIGGSNRIVVDTKIKGEIFSKSDFRIDGEVEGDIQTTGRLVIGKNGLVKGKVVCENADIEGKVEGEVRVSNVLTLKATAQVSGEVYVNKLSIEPGATFNVNCSMGEGKKVTKESQNESTASSKKETKASK